MRRSAIPFVALAFCGGLLLHCELGAPAHAGGNESGVPHRNGTRLKAIVETSADGAVIPTGQWWDSELETRCVPAYAVDGSRRCLPVLYGEHRPYMERTRRLGSDCAGVEVVLFDSLLDLEDPFVALPGEAVEGKTTYRIFRRGAEHESYEGTSVYSEQSETCIHYAQADSTSPGRRFFELGNEMGPGDFALLTRSPR